MFSWGGGHLHKMFYPRSTIASCSQRIRILLVAPLAKTHKQSTVKDITYINQYITVITGHSIAITTSLYELK